MKKNTFKLVAFFLGAAVVVSSCVKTEELDSVKAMREAKVDNIKASTALTNADAQIKLATAAATRIQNAYDSVNNSYDLQVNAAKAKYNATLAALKEAAAVASSAKSIDSIKAEQAKAVAQQEIDLKDLEKTLEVSKSDLAVQLQTSLQKLSDARVELMKQQILEIQQQDKLLVEQSNNPVKKRLLADYNVYYTPAGGTLSDGSVIAKGIYTLKDDILLWQANILTYTGNKNALPKAYATSISSLKTSIRQDSLEIEDQKRLLSIGIAAKNTQDYSAAYASLVTLEATAYNDLNAKTYADTMAKIKYDTAKVSFEAAGKAITTNNTAKTNAKTAMTAALGAFTSIDQLKNDATIKTADLDASIKEVAAWEVRYTAALTKLNDSAKVMNAQLILRDEAKAILTAQFQQTGVAPSTSDSTNYKIYVASYAAALAKYNSANAKYSSVLASLNTEKANLASAQTALATNDSNVKKYNENVAIYDAAVSKEASLLASKNIKEALYNSLKAEYDVALNAKLNALSYYSTVKTNKDNMKAVINAINGGVAGSEVTVENTGNRAIDNMIAAANKEIETRNASIAGYKLDLTMVGKKPTSETDAKNLDIYFDSKIAECNTKITVAQGLVTLYETAAAAIKAKIDKL